MKNTSLSCSTLITLFTLLLAGCDASINEASADLNSSKSEAIVLKEESQPLTIEDIFAIAKEAGVTMTVTKTDANGNEIDEIEALKEAQLIPMIEELPAIVKETGVTMTVKKNYVDGYKLEIVVAPSAGSNKL